MFASGSCDAAVMSRRGHVMPDNAEVSGIPARGRVRGASDCRGEWEHDGPTAGRGAARNDAGGSGGPRAHRRFGVNEDFPPYPAGLRLAGRRVLVVGGGHVAQRRIPRLISAGADVVVISPVVTPAVEGLSGSGEIAWVERRYVSGDVEGAWYVIAATDDPEVNALVSREAEERRTFCVRADDATEA